MGGQGMGEGRCAHLSYNRDRERPQTACTTLARCPWGVAKSLESSVEWPPVNGANTHVDRLARPDRPRSEILHVPAGLTGAAALRRTGMVRATAALTGLVLVMGASASLADSPRARSLTFSPDEKEWVEQPPPSAGTPEGDLHDMRRLLRDGASRKALTATHRFEKKYGEHHALFPEVLLVRAEAHVRRGDLVKAHKLLKSFLERYGGMTVTTEAIRLEFVIAESFLAGAKRKFLGLKIIHGTELALGILDDISTNYPDRPESLLAIKTKGDYFFRKGDFDLAEIEYARLAKDYSLSRYHRFALRRAADSTLASFRGIPYDDASLVEARERYTDYLNQYPDVAGRADENVNLILTDIAEKRAEKMLSIADWYARTDHLASAAFYLERTVRDFPDTAAAVEARARLDLLRGAAAPPGG